TVLQAGDGGARVVLPPMSVPDGATVTMVPGPAGFEVMAAGSPATVLETYSFDVGGQSAYVFPSDKLPTVTVETPATPATTTAYQAHTLVIASREPGDVFIPIPACASGQTTADGRCTTVTDQTSTYR